MKRRTFITAATTGTFIVSGCLSRGTTGSSRNSQNKEIKSYDFSIVGTNPSGSIDAPPMINFDAERNQVVVTGKMWKGNPCKAAYVDVIDYTSSDKLNIVIRTKKDGDIINDIFGCQDSLVSVEYRLKILFKNSLPKSVKQQRNHQKDLKHKQLQLEMNNDIESLFTAITDR